MTREADRPIRDRLRAALPAALKARDRPAAAAIRSALGAIDNAEAVTATRHAAPVVDGPIAGAVAGVGRADVPRRSLDEAEMRALVIAEVAERRRLAADCERLARDEEARQLRAQATLLETYLEPPADGS